MRARDEHLIKVELFSTALTKCRGANRSVAHGAKQMANHRKRLIPWSGIHLHSTKQPADGGLHLYMGTYVPTWELTDVRTSKWMKNAMSMCEWDGHAMMHSCRSAGMIQSAA